MALIKCGECQNEVSDRAAACPHCGNPMSAAPAAVTPVETQPGHVVTTEATGKTHKILQAVGTGVFLLGLVSCVVATGFASNAGAALAFLGALVYVAGATGAWWHHA